MSKGVTMDIIKRRPYTTTINVLDARFKRSEYVKAREKDNTCLAIVACPKCGTPQFIASARNTINKNGVLADFNCKAGERKCAYSEPVMLEKYYDEF